MPTLSEQFTLASIDTAARQWIAMGVALAGDTCPGNAVLDPEALILFTAALGDADARLRDESMDWCVQYGKRLISASRLRNLRAFFPPESEEQVDEYFATVNKHGGTRWLVRNQSMAPLGFSPSKKSALPRLRKSVPLLRLQLRALFGVTARAEVIVALSLGADREQFRTASDLTSTGYSKRNIALVLEDLSLCELVSRKTLGNRIGYRLDARANLWKLAPGLQVSSAVRWDLRLGLSNAARLMVHRVETKKPILRSVEARRFVADGAERFDALEMTAPVPDVPEGYFELVSAWALAELLDSP
ncbi:MAG: hypothetical protein JKY37_03165 [Nannocystaceae bacterium]|nr:hypothetical protein [Nannocystaceae bacterium]